MNTPSEQSQNAPQDRPKRHRHRRRNRHRSNAQNTAATTPNTHQSGHTAAPSNANQDPRRHTGHGQRHRDHGSNGAKHTSGSNDHRDRQRRSHSRSNPNKISDHFNKKDFMCTCSECKGDVKISLGLIGALELLRAKTRSRITILQGYLCPEAAAKVKRIGRNYYTLGVAALIQVQGFSAPQVFKLAQSIDELKGIGLNLDKDAVHIDTRKEDERYLFLIKNGEHIDLTPELYGQYIDSAISA